MPTRINSLRSVAIDQGINRLHPLAGGEPVPLAPGHAAEVIRVGGGGRVFVVVLQPAAREAGWSAEEEQGFRTIVQKTLDTEFRGHGPIAIEYTT